MAITCACVIAVTYVCVIAPIIFGGNPSNYFLMAITYVCVIAITYVCVIAKLKIIENN